MLSRIVEVGLNLVCEEGFDALTMQRLATELDYAPAALYRYFPSKDQLILAVQLRVLELLAQDLAAALDQAQAHLSRSRQAGEAEAALVPLIVTARVYATLPIRRPAHAALLSRWLALPNLLVELGPGTEQIPKLLELFSVVPRAFARAAECGALSDGDPMRRSIALWSALQGTMQMRKLERFELDALRYEPLFDEVLCALFVGWGAEADAYGAARTRAKKLVPQTWGSESEQER
jgi:AcrR family transcriptional regulator